MKNKKFLWYNLNKLKKDAEYFNISILSLILMQCGFYLSYIKNTNLISSLVLGVIFSIFFIYALIIKKDFSIKEAIKNFLF